VIYTGLGKNYEPYPLKLYFICLTRSANESLVGGSAAGTRGVVYKIAFAPLSAPVPLQPLNGASYE